MADDTHRLNQSKGNLSEKVVARGEEQTASVNVPVPMVVRVSREKRNRLPLSLCVCLCVTLACYLAPEKFGSSVRDR